MESEDEDLSDLNEEFTSQILSGVRFAPLVMSPVVNTIIPSRVWSPSLQRGYPCEFKLASKQLLMCSNSQLVQPIRLPSIEERINVSAMLPRTIWLEILSYTHRKCELILIFMCTLITSTADELTSILLACQGFSQNKMRLNI